jgi:hypothetical protein
MKSTYISILLVFLAGLAFYGYSILWQSESEPTPVPIAQEKPPEVIETQETDTETKLSPEELQQLAVENAEKSLNSAIISSDPSLCDDITIAETKNECIEKSNLALAQKNNDPSKCDFLSGSWIIECKDQIYFRIAQKSTNPEDCAKIESSWMREKCSQSLELTILKEQLNKNKDGVAKIDCDLFKNELAKEQCKADLKVANDQKELTKAIENQSTDNCNLISAIDIKQDCKDAVYYSRAKSNRSGEICENIVNNDLKKQCQITIADASDSSIFAEALEKQEVSICNAIQAADMKQGCIDRIRISDIIETWRKADCAELVDPSLRKSCESSLQ